MDRKQFTFYGSFLEGIARIRNKSVRCDAYDAIVRYALKAEEPDLDKLPDAAATAFIMARPVLDAAKKKAEAGRKGGESKPQANGKQTEANPKQVKGQEKEQVKEQMLKESTKEKRSGFQAPTAAEVAEYCWERGNSVNPQRFCDFYGRQGWKLNNGQPMKDWKAAVRLWERDEKKPTPMQTAEKRELYARLLAEEGETA